MKNLPPGFKPLETGELSQIQYHQCSTLANSTIIQKESWNGLIQCLPKWIQHSLWVWGRAGWEKEEMSNTDLDINMAR